MTLTDHSASQRSSDIHSCLAGGVQHLSADHAQRDAHTWLVGGEQLDLPAGANEFSNPTSGAPRLADPLLNLRAEILSDLEGSRIANVNRLRALTTPADQMDKDGITRGLGLSEDDPLILEISLLVDAVKDLEVRAARSLERTMKAHPLRPWVDSRIGVGYKQIARLLAVLGDPYWNTLHNRPRTVSELWAYCGLHTLPASQPVCDTQTVPAGGSKQPGSDIDQQSIETHGMAVNVAARRRKGQKANWSTQAKTRSYLIAESCIKQSRSPFRAVYDQRRAWTAVTHPEWTPGHSHNDALRVVSKAILKDLWIASRDCA